MKKIIYSAALVAIAALAGCGGDRTASVPDKVSATGSIPGDEPIPIIEKLGLPEKCRQPAAFDQECADQIDSAYGKGAGADAKLKLDFCGAYGGWRRYAAQSCLREIDCAPRQCRFYQVKKIIYSVTLLARAYGDAAQRACPVPGKHSPAIRLKRSDASEPSTVELAKPVSQGWPDARTMPATASKQ